MLVEDWYSSRDGGNCAGCNALPLGVLVANVNTSEKFLKKALGGTESTKKNKEYKHEDVPILWRIIGTTGRHPLVDSHSLTNEA